MKEHGDSTYLLIPAQLLNESPSLAPFIHFASGQLSSIICVFVLLLFLRMQTFSVVRRGRLGGWGVAAAPLFKDNS